MNMHRFGEWGIVALCTVSFFAYVSYSRAVETYLALYLKLFEKLQMILGN